MCPFLQTVTSVGKRDEQDCVSRFESAGTLGALSKHQTPSNTAGTVAGGVNFNVHN